MQALFVFTSVKLHLATFSFKNLVLHQDNIPFYYMAVSYKDLELPNPWICLAEIDIDHGLDFPI